MGKITLVNRIQTLAITMLLGGVVVGCTTTPPIQEMSDARQAIQAAREVEAQVYAPDNLSNAERLLDKAARELEAGNYKNARQDAVEARREAFKARHTSAAGRVEERLVD